MKEKDVIKLKNNKVNLSHVQVPAALLPIINELSKAGISVLLILLYIEDWKDNKEDFTTTAYKLGKAFNLPTNTIKNGIDNLKENYIINVDDNGYIHIMKQELNDKYLPILKEISKNLNSTKAALKKEIAEKDAKEALIAKYAAEGNIEAIQALLNNNGDNTLPIPIEAKIEPEKAVVEPEEVTDVFDDITPTTNSNKPLTIAELDAISDSYGDDVCYVPIAPQPEKSTKEEDVAVQHVEVNAPEEPEPNSTTILTSYVNQLIEGNEEIRTNIYNHPSSTEELIQQMIDIDLVMVNGTINKSGVIRYLQDLKSPQPVVKPTPTPAPVEYSYEDKKAMVTAAIVKINEGKNFSDSKSLKNLQTLYEICGGDADCVVDRLINANMYSYNSITDFFYESNLTESYIKSRLKIAG